MRITRLSALVGLVALLSPVLSMAEEDVVLVELYTSQGCSSCPPADRNLADLKSLEGVLPLSLHVDYWDYLGWRDTFGRRKHTERQFAYRDLMGARVVYTPQMIVHGTRDVPGYRPGEIKSAIAEIAAQDSRARIAISEEGGILRATISAPADDGPCTIYVAKFTNEATVTIERGENKGRSITYHNVVDEIMLVGPWRGGAGREIDLPRPSQGEGIVVWIQEDKTGRIVTASFING
ncbi:MAG: DUF1223 domain-containing protein [Pseudomonadota bacterium]